MNIKGIYRATTLEDQPQLSSRAVDVFFAVMLLLALAATVTQPARAGNINLYGIGGHSHISKPVISMREQKFTNLVEQKFDFSCGAAAVATILKYAYDQKDLTELDVLEGMIKVSDEELVKEKGFSLLDVRNYVETLGLRGRGYEIPASTLYEVRIPTIVLLDIRGYKHFVVLRRVVDEQVFVGDPALGNRTMSMDDFVESWNGTIFAVVGRGFDRETVLRTPEEPLSARSLMVDKGPISDTELLDFGFQHAELF